MPDDPHGGAPLAAPFIPQVLVNTAFQQTPTGGVLPLQACVVGPHAQTVRYGQPDEKTAGALGVYDSTRDVDYNWPGLAPGGLVDLPYTKLFADNAKMVFYQETQGGGVTVTPVGGAPNKVEIGGSEGFAVSGAHARLAGLYGRDVQPGDRVRVSGVVGSTTYQLDSYVLSLDGPTDSAVLAAASTDSANAATQGAAVSVTQVAGTVNCLTLAADATGYNGLVSGVINETYTVSVLTPSTGTDITTGTLRVKSASGLDDVLSIAPAGPTVYKAVGARGLQLSFSNSGGPCDLLAGQAWQVSVAQAFTATTVTRGGTYAGTQDDTYVVTVTRGGFLADSDANKRPQWTVTTVKGLDASGPTSILQAATAYPIGTLGATLMVGGGVTGLCKGDRFYVQATAAKPGLRNRLVLANSLPDSLQSASDMSLWLYVQKDVEVPRARYNYNPLTNYDAAPAGLTVNGGIVLTDSAFVDGDGLPLALPLLEADLFVEYRAWVPALAGAVRTISDVGNINDISGALDPDNPLKWGVSKALVGNAGSPVLYISVADPASAASWAAAIKQLVGREDVYNIVPLTYDPAILNLFAAHVIAQSKPEKAQERALFLGLTPKTLTQVTGPATSTDAGVVLATLADDPDSVNTQYTLLSVPADNAKFIKNAVQVGDLVRYNYTTAYGEQTYSVGQVARVLSEQSLLLAAGFEAPVAQAQRLEIWHPLSLDEVVTDLKAQAGAFAHPRICAVWSDLIGLERPTTETYFIAAALAGLASGSLPHQGLTNVTVEGFADVVSANGLLNADEIADLCGNGVWVVSRTPSVQSNAVVTRLAATTDVSSIQTREEMIRRNVDSMVKFCRNRLKQYLGTTNVTPSAEVTLRVEVDACRSLLMSNGFTPRLGAQLIDWTDITIRPSAALPDRMVIGGTWQVPVPMNTIELNVTIVV